MQLQAAGEAGREVVEGGAGYEMVEVQGSKERKRGVLMKVLKSDLSPHCCGCVLLRVAFTVNMKTGSQILLDSFRQKKTTVCDNTSSSPLCLAGSSKLIDFLLMVSYCSKVNSSVNANWLFVLDLQFVNRSRPFFRSLLPLFHLFMFPPPHAQIFNSWLFQLYIFLGDK